MKAIIEEGSEEIGQKMQMLALAEGALPKHLLTALFTKSTDGRLLTHCQLSRHLVGLWVTGNDAAMLLLKRILVRTKTMRKVLFFVKTPFLDDLCDFDLRN